MKFRCYSQHTKVGVIYLNGKDRLFRMSNNAVPHVREENLLSINAIKTASENADEIVLCEQCFATGLVTYNPVNSEPCERQRCEQEMKMGA